MGPLEPYHVAPWVSTLCLKRHVGIPLFCKGASETLPNLVDEAQMAERWFW